MCDLPVSVVAGQSCLLQSFQISERLWRKDGRRREAMATRSDSSLPLAFAAHQLAERRKTMKAREKRLRENDFAIQASQTLSEEPSIINYCEQGIAVEHRAARSLLCYTSMQFVILSEAKNLSFLVSTRSRSPIIRDVSRRSK